MDDLNPNFDAWNEFFVECFTSGCEITLAELRTHLGLDHVAVLTFLTWTSRKFESVGLQMYPAIEEDADLEIVRLIQAPSLEHQGKDHLNDVEIGENHHQEFKSSLWYDRQRAQHQPDASKEDLKNPDLVHEVVRAIAAMLNSEGGTVWVGVDDHGNPVGLEEDLDLLNLAGPDWRDKFVLHLVTKVKGSVRDGSGLTGYFRATVVDLDGTEVCRIDVRERRTLTFVKDRVRPDRLQMFERDGPSSPEIHVEGMEEFLTRRAQRHRARS